MSLLDENIDIPFETLLESLGWSKTGRYGCSSSYTYSGLDCAQRYFSIGFFPKGYTFKVYDKSTQKRLRKDL